jgi:two-component system sensor histidine kinase BaeS
VSFRLRIFMLVMLVAVTAIGATAWLILSLASGAVERAQQAETRHQNEIVEAVQRHGLRNGRWPGVDAVVADLSERTGLHIQLRTEDGEVLVDSDTLQGRTSGLVRGAALEIDPRPRLSPEADRDYVPIPEIFKPDGLPVGPVLVPRDLFGTLAADGPQHSASALMVRQVAQYRAALVAVRCMADEAPVAPMLVVDEPPYLTPEQIRAHPTCVDEAVAKVTGDAAWLKTIWSAYTRCVQSRGQMEVCLQSSFTETVSTPAAVPLRLYLGGREGADVTQLGRPAALGLAGLVVIAVLGTALIARRVSRPVRTLTEASRRLADGRFDVRVPDGGRGELALLSASFNAMAEAVQRSEERQRRLIADVAHEMRTPLSNLRGYLEGLSDGVVEPSRDLFASLHEETLLQGRILDDLQVLALAEAGDLGYTKAPIDLADLARAGATAHRAVAAEAEVAMTVDAPAPVWVEADPDRLRQVLGNLLTNAIRYTDAGGHVLVRVRALVGEAVLIVEDTGVGIAAEDLRRVFDRFWRADPARQRATGGTGLGLTIAHRIVTDHGGRVEVASRPGVGTTFTVHLPPDRRHSGPGPAPA